MDKICGTCRWWERRIGVYTNGPCRRYPPQVTNRPGQALFEWPITITTDFCGEHTPKEPPHD